MSEAENPPPPPSSPEAPPALLIHKLYVKDVSFESPHSPVIFNESWQPQAEVNIQNSARKVGDALYEVVLTVTVTARVGDKVGFLIEVQQAGLFGLDVPDEDAARPVIGGACPGILFPYAREAVSNLAERGGFPPLLLAPTDFNALYHQQHSADPNGTV